MKIIEPCCVSRQLMGLRRAIASGGTMGFEGYGDLSLTELLPAILTRYSETRLLIAAPSLPGQATDIIAKWMRRQWARMDGQGRLDAIAHLTVVTCVELSPAVGQWLGTGAFAGRLTVVDAEQADTVILLPDFAVEGPVNMQYSAHFTATATTEPERVAALWEKYTPKADEPAAEEAPAAEPGAQPGEVPAEGPSAEEEPAGRQKPRRDKKKDAE